MIKNFVKRSLKNLVANKDGNFLMMSAILTPVLLAGASVTLDLANMSALKERLQAASDATTLATTTRIAKGQLTLAEAPDFAKAFMQAQMASESSRFNGLKVLPEVNVVETEKDNVKTWEVTITGSASQKATPIAAFIGVEHTKVSIDSAALSGLEEIQGSLSMGLVIDVSGSMGSYINNGNTGRIKTTLGVHNNKIWSFANRFIDVLYYRGLTPDAVKYILRNYTIASCNRLNSNTTPPFLVAINQPPMSVGNAKKLCRDTAALGQNYGTTSAKILANFDTVVGSLPTTKMTALKIASNALLKQFTAADPDEKYVRTGTSMYNHKMTGTTDFEWGVESAAAYIAKQRPGGGTVASRSLKWTYDKLKVADGKEIAAHKAKNGQDPDRFILYMTDGANNPASDDVPTRQYCDQAKADGIVIYAVAFAAPSRGEKLLNYCASSGEHYFEPSTAQELIESFEQIGKSTAKTLSRLTH